MEDLWRVQGSGINVDEIADIAEYRQFLKRFNAEEENDHRRRLLFGDAPEKKLHE